jgi:hypothetical protein
MHSSRSLLLPALVALALGAASQAHAGMVSLGTNFGLTIHHPSGGGGNTTIFGLPGSTFGFQPGIRVGFQPGGTTHELFLDTGLLSLSSGGSTERLLQASVNYQYNFSSKSKTRPYLTAGLGFFNEHSSGENGETSGLGGGGIGIRQWVAEDHGALRLEVRYDHLGWSSHGAIGKAGLTSIKAGIDLWMK